MENDFKARNWNKLRSSTDNSQSLNPISVSGVRDSLLWSSYILVERLCEPISFCSRTVLGIVKKQLNDVGRRIAISVFLIFNTVTIQPDSDQILVRRLISQ